MNTGMIPLSTQRMCDFALYSKKRDWAMSTNMDHIHDHPLSKSSSRIHAETRIPITILFFSTFNFHPSLTSFTQSHTQMHAKARTRIHIFAFSHTKCHLQSPRTPLKLSPTWAGRLWAILTTYPMICVILPKPPILRVRVMLRSVGGASADGQPRTCSMWLRPRRSLSHLAVNS